MSKFPIFVSSSDAYADLWPIFFDLFKKYWPEYDGVIYLNTETLTFQYDGLNIRCTHIGRQKHFGKSFHDGLTQISSNTVLLIMIDYFFMAKVDDAAIRKYYDIFMTYNLDSLCLIHQNYDRSEVLGQTELRRVIPPSRDMFSLQIAFWKTEKLREMVFPHENPWMTEWFGTRRANALKISLAFPPKKAEPIVYLAEGALHKGKWVDPMVNFLTANGYVVDYKARGYFQEVPMTIGDRFRMNRMIYYSGFLSLLYRMMRVIKKILRIY